MTGSAALLAFIAISLSVEKLLLVGIFVALGIIMSVVVYGVVSSMITNSSVTETLPNEAVPEVKAVPEIQAAPVFEPKSAQTLMILQKKGRLIDFLQEDVSRFSDAQIGNAVRAIHSGCREALTEYIKIEPVRHEPEGNDVTVEAGFDPSALRLTGNVTGQPPFRGVLRHCGWRVVKTTLPEISGGQDLSIVEPAEVEIL
ncbi:MAG: DUF2760 domain-containing protein [Nitrospirota bacterium]